MYSDMVLKENKTTVLVTFGDCNCRFEFDRRMLAQNQMSIMVVYCKKYPSCRKVLATVFAQARELLLAEASEPTLVIPDDEAEEFMGMNWTGLV